jgi:hypothetical protein
MGALICTEDNDQCQVPDNGGGIEDADIGVGVNFRANMQEMMSFFLMAEMIH